MRRLLANLVLACLPLVVATGVEAAAIDLRATDRLDLAAPSVTVFPPGTSSVVAAAAYRDVGRGATIDLAVVDASSNRVAVYREPIWEAGSGSVLARLIAAGPLSSGVYRLQASGAGASPAEVTFTVGTGGLGLGGAPAAAVAPGPAPSGGPAPVQLAPVLPIASIPRLAAASALSDAFSSRALAGERSAAASDRQDGFSAGAVLGGEPNPSDRRAAGRFALANVMPDGAAVPGVPGAGGVAWMARAREAGAGGNRWELRWDAIERVRGSYDWAEVDRVVAANQGAGMPLLAILIGTPIWAGTAAGAPPVGLDAPSIMPDGSLNSANPWGRFVHDLASRYRGRIDAYEIWNEPNRPDFWSGSPAQYYRLLSVATAAIRHADPAAKVVFGGIDGYRDLTFLDGVLEVAMADPAPPGRRGGFDVLGWHVYHRPIDVYVGTWAIRERLRARGLAQPIWITETNVAAWDDRRIRGEGAQPYRWSATGQEQATFVLEAFAYALAADVERVYLYRASDAGEREAWGLLQVDGTPRPVERAFRFATELLGGATRARRLGGEGIERIVVDRPDARVTIAWATGPADAPLVFDALSTAPAVLRDKIGGLGAIAPIDGRIVLSLPGASANQGISANDYLIGGDPYVVVEATR